ncbi:MAG: hypothetical protein ACOY0T_33450 [Myxococcota bacterium]
MSAKPNVADYLGTWRIKRFAKLDRGSIHLTDAYAKSQLGKTATLSIGSASFDDKFLWRGGRHCNKPSYRWATDDEFIGHGHQALLPLDHPDKRGDLLFLDVDCDGERNTFGCELTVRDECSAYYDGFAFFLAREVVPTR